MAKSCRRPCLTRFLVLLMGIATLASAREPADYFENSYAVVIGIRDYQEDKIWGRLTNAENDATDFSGYLKDQGFIVKTFISREAKKNELMSYLEDELAPRLAPNDRLVFYFSGHGETKQLGGKDWGYIIPYDGTGNSSSWIAMETLQELADKLGNTRHQLFIFDSCFGGLFATKSTLSSLPEKTPNYVAKVTGQKARQYLTAGGAKQRTPAQSTLAGYKNYSHFTAHLLKALKEGFADTYRDGVITASELDAYLGPAASSRYNTPRGGNFAGHEQGNFVFLSPKPSTSVNSSALQDTVANTKPGLKGSGTGGLPSAPSGQVVSNAQSALRALGFVVGEEGKLDRRTEDALLAFQSLASLPKTGTPDAATLSELDRMRNRPRTELSALRDDKLNIIIVYQIGAEPTVDALTARLSAAGVNYTLAENYDVPSKISGRLYFGQDRAGAAQALRALSEGLVDLRLTPSATAGDTLRVIIGLNTASTD